MQYFTMTYCKLPLLLPLSQHAFLELIPSKWGGRNGGI